MDRHQVLQRIHAEIDHLPTLPTVLPRVLKLVEDPDSSAQEIVEAITPDLALTARILKAANSAYYGIPSSISNLERAVPLLGLGMVKSLALAMGVIECLPQKIGGKEFAAKDLWVHSLAVATAVDEMGHLLDVKTGYLFTMGLLHDVGQIILAQFFREEFFQALELCRSREDFHLHDAERELLGVDHGEVGAMLLKRWKLPASIVKPVAAHHIDGFPKGVDELDLALLRVGDFVSQQAGLYHGGNPVPYKVFDHDLEILEMEPKVLDQVREHLVQSREKIEGFFQAMG